MARRPPARLAGPGARPTRRAHTTRLGLEHGTRDIPVAGCDARARHTGAQHLHCLTWVVSSPRRLASVEDRPKSRAQRGARGIAHLLRPTKTRGTGKASEPLGAKMALLGPSLGLAAARQVTLVQIRSRRICGDFPRKESHPGVAAPVHPCARGICASCTSQGAERPALFNKHRRRRLKK